MLEGTGLAYGEATSEPAWGPHSSLPRFFCLLLGPPTLGKVYGEMGRAAAVLLSNQVSTMGTPARTRTLRRGPVALCPQPGDCDSLGHQGSP